MEGTNIRWFYVLKCPDTSSSKKPPRPDIWVSESFSGAVCGPVTETRGYRVISLPFNAFKGAINYDYTILKE
jgi:hypothetical protein